MMRSDVYVDGFLLQSDSGETMGYALVSKTFSQEPGGRAIWVEELSVLPEFRGQGLGSEAPVLLHEPLTWTPMSSAMSPMPGGSSLFGLLWYRSASRT